MVERFNFIRAGWMLSGRIGIVWIFELHLPKPAGGQESKVMVVSGWKKWKHDGEGEKDSLEFVRKSKKWFILCR